MTALTIDDGIYKQPATKDIERQFYEMIDSVEGGRIKFLLLQKGVKPKKYSGYLHAISISKLISSTCNVFIDFKHLKDSTSYMQHGYLPLKNIKFFNKSFEKYVDYIHKNKILNFLFKDHFTEEIAQQSKFDI